MEPHWTFLSAQEKQKWFKSTYALNKKSVKKYWTPNKLQPFRVREKLTGLSAFCLGKINALVPTKLYVVWNRKPPWRRTMCLFQYTKFTAYAKKHAIARHKGLHTSYLLTKPCIVNMTALSINTLPQLTPTPPPFCFVFCFFYVTA